LYAFMAGQGQPYKYLLQISLSTLQDWQKVYIFLVIL